MTAILSLTSRELKRFYRQRSRIVGSLLTPVVFWILLGTGLTAAFPEAGEARGRGFIDFFFPANLVMTLLFTALFSTISIIEDRHQGFLQGVIVSPISRFSLVGGKVCGGTLISMFQGLLFLALAPWAGIPLTGILIFKALLSMAVMGLTMTSLGFLFAWRIDSVQGFHSIMNLVLFPMWLISGAFFPYANAPLWLQTLMKFNPLFYGVSSLQHALYGSIESRIPFSFETGLGGCLLFAMAFYLLSVKTVRKGSA